VISLARGGLSRNRHPRRKERRVRARGGETRSLRHIIEGEPTELQPEIDVVLRRFSEFQNLEGAFGRRIITECQGDPDGGI